MNRARIPLRWPLLVVVLGVAAAMRGKTITSSRTSSALSYATFFIAYVAKLPHIRHHDISYGLYLYGWPSQQLVLHLAPGTGPLFNTFWATLLAGGAGRAVVALRRTPRAAPEVAVGRGRGRAATAPQDSQLPAAQPASSGT